MIFNFYIFGTPNGRYSQFPNDYIAPTLKTYQANAEGSRLVIHREENLVHYIFTECIDKNNTIGVCIIFNGVHVLRPMQLFTFLRHIVEDHLVQSGKIIRYSDDGVIYYAITSFNECTEETHEIQSLINDELEHNAALYHIEPINNQHSFIKTEATLGSDAPDELIIQQTNQHNTVIITDKTGIKNGYLSNIINNLKERIQLATNEIKRLEEEKDTLNRKKKQYSLVAFLSLVILGCFVCLYLLFNDANDKAEHINQLEKTITKKNAAIEERDHSISELQNSVSDLHDIIGTISSYKLSTGSTIRNSDNQDSAWILWIKAKQKIQIESFYIKSQTSGSVDIGLFDTNDNLIASVETNVYEGEFRKVIVDSEWTINSGAYYMKIRSGVSLQYHSSNDGEYGQFSGGALEVTGACNYSERSDETKKNNHSYYQYFYNIQYHIVVDG